MANSAAKYTMIAVLPGGSTKRSETRGAPTESQLCNFGGRFKAIAVIRYFPSRKGWRVLDTRAAKVISSSSGRVSFWKGQVRGTTYFPNEDAAVMAAIHLLA